MDKKQRKARNMDIIGITSGCILALILLFNVISSGVAAAKSAPPKDAQTLTGVAAGRNGDVAVEVVATADKIYSVAITEHSETEGIGSLAVEQMPGKIVNAQRLDVDAVSSATMTSIAIKEAVSNALASGGIDPTAFGGTVSAPAAAIELEGPVTGDDGKVIAQGQAPGRNGPVAVEVTVADGKIESVVVLSHEETDGIGSVAVEQIPGAIVDAQSLDVDSVSSATVTSDAIKEAVKAALISAGLDPAAYSGKGSAPAVPGEDAVYNVDVVVIGGGGAGMTAAIVAKDAGADVLLLESQALVGGNSVRSTGGMNAGKTEWQDANTFDQAAGVEATLKKVPNFPDNERIQKLAAIVEEQWAAYQENPVGYFDSVELFQLDTLIGGGGMNDPDLVKTLAENSAGAIEWMDSLDPAVTLHNVAAFGGASVKRIHRPVDDEGKVLSVGAYVVPLLKKNLDSRGINLLLSTTANEILLDDKGAACGVIATGSKGETITVNAKAVVIATGGFGANNDMIASIRPELDGFITTNAPGIKGQGIQMAQAIGADTVDMEQIQLHPTVHVEGNDAVLITEGLRGDGAILVNQEGQRFFDEVSTRDKVSAAEFEQTGGYAWLIVDSRMSDASNVIQGYINKGYAVSGESYEALAEAIGAPADVFAATMTDWNAKVANKEDKDFGRVSFAQPLDQAPYYAIKVQPGIHHTMGGIKINSSAEVISTKGNPIPGLFAAGETTGGVHGNNRLGGNAVADFTIYGRIAGESASAYAAGTAAKKVATMSGVSVMHASDWEKTFPDQYNSWAATANNDELVDYLELNPYLRTLYEGYGFAKDYKGARGHYYDVEDISETGRPHPLANCWTCKTPDFTNMVNEMGVEAYKLDWEEVKGKIVDPISCYNCHANDPMSLTVTHTYWIDALGGDYYKVPAADMSCGQCHNEYYFEPETKATTIAHDSLASMAPEKILAYFNDPTNFSTGEAFSDWTNPRTGVKQIKVQHPEFETVLGEGSIIGGDFTCADCHMPEAKNEKGISYSSHELVTPLTDPSIFESKCTACHTDGYDSFVAMIRSIQDEVKGRTDEIGYKLQELTELLAEAVEAGKLSDEDLAHVRQLARDAQFYWDFVFVENSDGAHNSALSNNCLDKAEELCGQAMSELQALMSKAA